ncbi:MAG TPA: carbon storage regulator [Bryobacteraceae bacterium]|nr:carbon storage regulator [Bryobacteraceae bacterium]
MLVIRRRAGEAVLIGDHIEIEILDVTHTQVKLGIRAPKQVTVLRKEIHLTGEQNRVAAREVPPSAVGLLLDSLKIPGG